MDILCPKSSSGMNLLLEINIPLLRKEKMDTNKTHKVKMITNNVNKTNMDNVIPFNKHSRVMNDISILGGVIRLQEPLINETLIRLYEYPNRINKFTIKDFTYNFPKGLFEEDKSGVFDDFEISLIESDKTQIKPLFKCWFNYREDTKMIAFGYTKIGEDVGKILQFRKRDLKNDIRRKQISIWILSYVFSKQFDNELLDKVLYRGVFSDAHSVIIYD